jgi:hypothetical protein
MNKIEKIIRILCRQHNKGAGHSVLKFLLTMNILYLFERFILKCLKINKQGYVF